MRYGYSRKPDLSFGDAVTAVKRSLTEQGFGVLSEIDVRTKLKEKTGEDVGPYVILGACSPPDALRAVRAEKDIGLLLPCNVVVRQDGKKTVVSAMLPTVTMGFVENEALADIAEGVEERLVAAIDGI